MPGFSCKASTVATSHAIPFTSGNNIHKLQNLSYAREEMEIIRLLI